MRELKQETRYVYGKEIQVALGSPYQAGSYSQYFAKIPFRPVSYLMRSNLKDLAQQEPYDREMNAYMWIPLDVLLGVVLDAVGKRGDVSESEKYKEIPLPEKYIPYGVMDTEHGEYRLPYGSKPHRHCCKPVRNILRKELAETLHKLAKNEHLRGKYIKVQCQKNCTSGNVD